MKTRSESFIGLGVFVLRKGAYICGAQGVFRFSCEMGRMRGSSDEFNDVDIDGNEISESGFLP
jgi:hypothetical protein